MSPASWIIRTYWGPPPACSTMSSTSNTLMFRQWGKNTFQTEDLCPLVWVQPLCSHVNSDKSLEMTEMYFSSIKNKQGESKYLSCWTDRIFVKLKWINMNKSALYCVKHCTNTRCYSALSSTYITFKCYDTAVKAQALKPDCHSLAIWP